MSAALVVIVDESSGAFSYSWSGGNATTPWDMGSLPQWYGGTTRYPKSSATQIGSFTFTFNGTSAAFTGNTPPTSSPQTATVQIDNKTSFLINYQDPTPQTYMQWYITPSLPDGVHTITMSDLYLIAIDYAVVKVGNETPLTGKTVIVDDDSSLIRYSGQWSRSTSIILPGNLPKQYPYGNLTHRSSNPGDTFMFQFTGTSIAIYGIFSWYNLGLLKATYTLDGTIYSSSVSVTTSSPSYSNKDGEVSNYLHFSLDSLPPGTHTLVVNITEAINQTFILDYITYKPSFDTWSSMPSLSTNVGSSTTASKNSPTTSSVLVTSIVTTSGSRQSIPTGTIVGGVLGAVAFGVVVTILVTLIILRKRRLRRQKSASGHQEDSEISDNYPNSTPRQTQEPPPSSALNFRGPAKFAPAPQERLSPPSNDTTTPMESPITSNSTEDDGAFASPPSYDMVSPPSQGRPSQ